MSALHEIGTVAEAEMAVSGQWVQDANGKNWCLIDTHMGFPQRMAMHKRSLTALDNLAYPLHLGDFQGDCEHRWGTTELGNCYRCGVVVGEAHPVTFDAGQMDVFRAAAESNARYDAARKSSDSSSTGGQL